MNIRNDAEALKTFLGIPSAPAAPAHPVRSSDMAAGQAAFGGDQATFSQAATEVSLVADTPSARMEKVNAIQQALAAGTYNVPANAVAGKLIDTMLAGGLGSSN